MSISMMDRQILYRHFINSSGPLSFSYCVSKLEMPLSEKFRFTQISHFLNSIWVTKPRPLIVTPYEQWCTKVLEIRGGISLIFLALAETTDKASYMLGWERDLDFNWDINTWHLCFKHSFKGIQNISLIEANLKVFPAGTWYRSPCKNISYSVPFML